MTAATSYIRQTTGAAVDHKAAIRLMANESETRQATFGRTRTTIEPIATGCSGPCGQGRLRCTCRQQPQHTRFEVTLSDFGVLGLTHQEDEPTPREIDDALTPMLRTAARLWQRAWRIGLATAIVLGSIALAGCGGSDDHDDHFEPAVVQISPAPLLPPEPPAKPMPTTQGERAI